MPSAVVLFLSVCRVLTARQQISSRYLDGPSLHAYPFEHSNPRHHDEERAGYFQQENTAQPLVGSPLLQISEQGNEKKPVYRHDGLSVIHVCTFYWSFSKFRQSGADLSPLFVYPASPTSPRLSIPHVLTNLA